MTYYQLAKEKHERITWSANWSLSFFLSADNLWYQVWPAKCCTTNRILFPGYCKQTHGILFRRTQKAILNKEKSKRDFYW
jgi:hypothetical protein